MDYSTKIELAQALCREVGMEGRQKADRHHFDKGTGTLYVGSHMYDRGDMEAAKAYLLKRKLDMLDKNDAAAGYYELAGIAMEALIESNFLNGGRIVVKEATK